MSQVFREVASCAPSQKVDSYIYAIAPTLSGGLVAITSADEFLLLDLQHLQNGKALYMPDVPTGVTSMTLGDSEGTSVVCAGRDGVTATFDLRTQRRVSHFKQDRPVTALACVGNDIATGTELTNHQAVVSVWDRRQNKSRWQNTENNDDVTDLQFHPSNHARLLSGGVDGLVSIFDTTVDDEVDSLLQVVNHRPIHKAGFLDDRVIYALSSDEHLSLHPVSSDDDNDDPEPVMYGDLRESLQCEYAIGVTSVGLKGYLAVGSHSSNPRIELRSIKEGKLNSKFDIMLAGAHGEEIVRSLFADPEMDAIFTAGEDGRVKAFRSSTSETKDASASKVNKNNKVERTRFRPY